MWDSNFNTVQRAQSGVPSNEVGQSKLRRAVILGTPSLFHTGLSATLRAAPGIELVGEWDQSAAEVDVRLQGRTDIAVLDLDVWGVDGIDRLISGASVGGASSIGVIAVTASEDVDSSVDALYAGARGILLKDARPDEFVDAIHAVSDGSVVLAPHVVSWLLDEMLRNTRRGAANSVGQLDDIDPAGVSVTPRQQQTLRLLSDGLSNAEIAEHLDVTKATVKSHVSALLRTFNVRDRTQLALLVNQR